MRRPLALAGATAVLGVVGLSALDALRAAPPVISQTVAIVDATNPAAPKQAGVDSSGNLQVNCVTGCSAGSGAGANNADGVAAVGTGLGSSVGYNYVWNGATWDRQPGSATLGTSVNVGKYAGVTPDMNAGAAGATTPRVVLAANSPVNVGQINGVAVTMGNGASGTGVQRVTIASDSTGQVALAGGTNTVGKIGIDPSMTGLTPVVSSAAEASHVLKASAGSLWGVYAANLTGTAGFLVVLNATAAPADGAITPLACVPLTANGIASINYVPGPPAAYSSGITAVVTSATSCFTKTTGVITAFIGGQVQ
jgi:hypothetical protein